MIKEGFIEGPLDIFCIVFIVIWAAVSLFVIWENEYFCKRRRERGENQPQTAGFFYKDEAWRTCLKGIHPLWLLAYRILTFIALLTFLISIVDTFGASSFAFYPLWTFLLLTLYFGLGSFFSYYGCCLHREADYGDRVLPDVERSTRVAGTLGSNKNMSNVSGSLDNYGEHHVREAAGMLGYAFQICYQVCAGAVTLSVVVFWLGNSILAISKFSSGFERMLVLAVYLITPLVLIGESILNCLRFTDFRIAYFCIWTLIHILFRWICPNIQSAKFPFVDAKVSPKNSMLALLLGIPCYGVYALLIRMKRSCFSTLFPESFQREENE